MGETQFSQIHQYILQHKVGQESDEMGHYTNVFVLLQI